MMKEQSKTIIQDNWKSIHDIINNLWNLKFKYIFKKLNLDKDDFESLCMMLLCENIEKWDSKKASLKTFLTMVFQNRAVTYVKEQMADKRCATVYGVSIYEYIDHDARLQIADILQDENTVEDIIFHTDNEAFQKLMEDYCSRLSTNQFVVLKFLMQGYSISEIARMMGYSVKRVLGIRDTLGYEQYTKNIQKYMEVYAR